MTQDQKPKIQAKFIEIAASEGWNDQSLEKAVEAAGYEKNYTYVLYPGKIEEFTAIFIKECNTTAFKIAETEDFKKLRTTEKVRELIFARIKAYHDRLGTREALKKFAAYSANPAHFTTSLKNIYEFSSDTWYLLGDKSTDFSYYTKRLSLSGIYTKSMLYSLSDLSHNLESTKKFIQRSIDALMKINKLKQKIKEFGGYLPIKSKHY